MQDDTIRSIVLAVAGMLALSLLLMWLRNTEPAPALIGVLAVGIIATNVLRSFRVPLWRLKRMRCPRRGQARQLGWWRWGARQPSRTNGVGAGPPSPSLLGGGLMCAAVFAGVFFWPSDPRTLAARYSPADAIRLSLAPAAGPRAARTTHAAGRSAPRDAPQLTGPAIRAATFRCTVIGVHDGDGPIYCAEGPKIRLQAIAARETNETCRSGHPCPAASGAAATAALRGLTLGKVLRCEATGNSYSRVTAWCSTTEGVELNCAMVRSGTVAYWRRYDPDGRLCSG